MKRTLAVSYALGRKLFIVVLGATVVLLGVAMIPLPGPGLLVIPLGLAILAVEFAWARRWLEQTREGSIRLLGRLRRRPV